MQEQAQAGFEYRCEKFKLFGYKDQHGFLLPPLTPRSNGDGLMPLYGEKLDEWVAHNIMPTESLNYLLGAAFAGDAQLTAFYLGVYSANYDAVAADTLATFLASATESSAYTNATRVAYTRDAIASGVLNNAAAPAEFTFNGTVTITGGFITNQSAKASSTGKLISAVRFAASKSMAAGEILRIKAPLTLTSA